MTPRPTAGARMPAASWLAAAALLLVHAWLAWRLREPAVGLGDDATYVLLGRSLRSFAYESIHLVGAPRHVQYPPVFPGLLALAGALFGERFALFAALEVLLSAVGLGLLFVAVRRLWGPYLALLVLAACAANPALVESARSVLSESPFLALTMFTLWAAARGDGPPPGWLAAAGAGALAAALTRTAGVALVVALLLTWCTERRWRAAGGLFAAAAIVLGGWLLWSLLAPNDPSHYGYGADFARGYGAASPVPAPATTARAVAERVVAYLTRLVPWALQLPTIPRTRVDNVIWVGVLLGFGAAGLRALWRRWRAAALFVGCYAVVLAAWPWALERLLVPVIPLVLLTLLAGIDAVAARVGGGRLARLAPAALVAAAVAVAAGRQATALERHQRCLASGARGCLTATSRSFDDAAAYIRAHGDPGHPVLTFRGAGLHYRTGRLTIPPGALAAPGAESRPNWGLPPGTYVLLAQTDVIERTAATRLRARCDRLTLVRHFPPAALLLRAADGGADAGRAACAALDDFLSIPWTDRGYGR